MKLRVACTLEYEIPAPVTLILGFRARSYGVQQALSENLQIFPNMSTELIISHPSENCFDRIRITQPTALKIQYEAEVETHVRLLDPEFLRKVPPEKLDPSVLPFLFPSRYCQSDRLVKLAWQKFGTITDACDQVRAITQWIFDNIEYESGISNASTSAFDTVTQRVGVCRDFAHLGIALCRALNIPARYLSTYAADIEEPADFHACFEAYLGGYWVVFDATRMAPLNGLVRIGSGQDAADIAICTAFGEARYINHTVSCTPLDSFVPLPHGNPDNPAVCLDAEETVPHRNGGI